MNSTDSVAFSPTPHKPKFKININNVQKVRKKEKKNYI